MRTRKQYHPTHNVYRIHDVKNVLMMIKKIPMKSWYGSNNKSKLSVQKCQNEITHIASNVYV